MEPIKLQQEVTFQNVHLMLLLDTVKFILYQKYLVIECFIL